MTPDDTYYLTAPTPLTPEPGADPPAWKTTTVVGKRLPRIDAYERVSGRAVYSADVLLPDMLYAAVLRCPHAHATVKKVDTTKAEKMPGVAAILVDKTPGADIPWFSTRTGPLSRLFDPRCRYEGEEVAAVAAETPYQAWDAVRAIAVEYDVLPFVSDAEDALKPDAPLVHVTGNQSGEVVTYSRGTIEAGFAAADVVIEQTYTTACEIHAPTETHASVARWEGNRLVVWDSTQGVFPIQQGLVQTFKLPASNVRVIGHYMGGGFGSKLGLSKHTVIAALLARKTARPVKLHLTREESFLAVGNRPANKLTLKAGVKKDGTLTALQATVLGTGGAYPGGGVGSVDWVVRDLYACPNVKTELTDVYINAGQARAFRAPGHPQGAWALEQMMDQLAEKIGMDPIQLRLKNAPAVSQGTPGTPPYSTTGLKPCLEEGARRFGWAEAKHRAKTTEAIRRGVGVAAGLWRGGSGGPPSTVIVKLFADGSASLNMGASDLGTGTKTVMAMIVSEELGVPLDRIQVEWADTATTQYATASGGSKTVPTEGPATRAAALDVKQQLLSMAAEQLNASTRDLVLADGDVFSTVEAAKRMPLTSVNGLRNRGLILGVGYRGPNPPGKVTCPFAAHFAEVEVDTRTGEVKVLRYLAVQDSGRAMNELTFENQVQGAIAMGIGLAATEARVLDRGQTGKMVNRNWHDYKIPTALDVPVDPAVVAVDLHDHEANSIAAKGLGEPALVPVAAAIANAIYDACGVRTPDSPVNPPRLVELLAAQTRR